MSQFTNNPPWARSGEMPAGGGLAAPGIATPVQLSGGQQFSMSSQPSVQQQQQYTHAQQLNAIQTMQQQSLPQQLAQPGIAIPTSLATSQVATVSYPAPRGTQATTAAAGKQPAARGFSGTGQRYFTGTVTKLHDNFGFVDEDVFFQSNCVKGQMPKVNDRVLVEATYNANMPFKWNATRIQVLPSNEAANPSPQPQSRSVPAARGTITPSLSNNFVPAGTDLSRVPPPLMANATGQQQQQQPGLQPGLGLLPQPNAPRTVAGEGRENKQGGGNPRGRDRDRDRDRNDRTRNERKRSPRKRSRSPRRSRSPASRGARSPSRRARPANRPIPRYNVQVPKLTFDTSEATVTTVKSRYSNLYVPSDFFNAAFSWIDAFPLHRPFSLTTPCSFHIMHKDVAPIEPIVTPEPTDADHLYSAKVMLLSLPAIDDLYHKTCALAEDSNEQRENFQHPTRLINFLVGLKGKSEPMAIGGPWSPTLDGADPEGDPSVLIRTAIRNTKHLTGIDLAACTQWYRFAELRYHRPAEMHKGRHVAARVETVVIFLPDVWSVLPARLDWQATQAAYKMRMNESLTVPTVGKPEEKDEEEDNGEVEDKKEPTHYSELDPKLMKVAELRRELTNRSINSKGLLSQLRARLIKQLKTEQDKEELDAENKKDAEEAEEKVEEEEEQPELDEKEEERRKKEEEEKRKKEERERSQKERRYTLPDSPCVLVHPSATAKSGKFDCTLMSLSVLLDYRPEDNKEHSFEVSLFAELFNEMLMRDLGYRIYRLLLAAPEKVEKKEDKKDKKDDKKKDDKKDDKKKDDRKDDKKEDKADAGDDGKEEKEADKDGEPCAKKKKTEEKKSDDEKDEDDEDKDDEKDDDDKKDDDKKEKKRDKKVYYTCDRDALLAFSYFDVTHTGYILDKDVEEILHTLGLQLSRAQVKKLVLKCVTRDSLNYRRITDKALDLTEVGEPDPSQSEKEREKDLKAEAKAAAERAVEEAALARQASTAEEERTVGLGNRTMLRAVTRENVVASGVRESPKAMDILKPSNIVMYQGAMVDIASVMQRLERSEKARRVTEERLQETQTEISELKTSYSASESSVQKTAVEVSELKRKLREQKRATDLAESGVNTYKTSLELLSSNLHEATNVVLKALDQPLLVMPPNTKVEAKPDIKMEVNGDGEQLVV